MSKKRPARHGRSRSLAVSAWPLRRKVALALAIPLMLAATLGGLRVHSDLTEAANSSTSARQVTVLGPAVGYLTAAERAMVAAQDPSASSQAELKAAVKDVQTSADQLEAARNSTFLTDEQRYQIDAMLDLSQSLRDGNVDTLSPGTWVAQLRLLQSGVTQLISTIVNAQINPEPRLELLAQTLAGRFSLSMQQALAATERSGDTGSLELFSELGVEGAAIDRLATALGDSEPAVAALRTDNADRTRAVRTGADELGGADAYAEYDGLVDNLMVGIDDQLTASAKSARTSALVSGAITIAALLAAILLALLISRMILNPIRKVREGALEVANEQLPEEVARIRAGEDPGQIEPIDVTTHEEVGQLARAVDDLHRQAVHLASGEAALRSQVSEMFVTLSRRNTSLINQQLGLIETLEKDEEDPRRLESLFRLDHLASRMRRTADSLLILADAPTHSGGQDELTVADSLQAATAGVQDYQRVRISSSNTTTRINDAAAADVVHLLTELVDNALLYSPPTTAVTVTSSASIDGIKIEVSDSGLGIPEKTLAEVNENLRSGGDVTPDTARRMGLFVVSRLAQKHGILASLQRNGTKGTTAVVILPRSILRDQASPVSAVAPLAPAAAVAAASAAPAAPLRDAASGLPVRERPAGQPGGVPVAPAAVVPVALPVAGLPSAPVASPAASPVAGPPAGGGDLEARINAVMRQPNRPASPVGQPAQPAQPAAPPAPTGPQLPVRTPGMAGSPASPVAPIVPAAQAGVERAGVEKTDQTPANPYSPLGSRDPEPSRPVLAAVAPEATNEPLNASRTGIASVADESPLGPYDPHAPGNEPELDTPIFKELRSAWLTAGGSDELWRSTEIEAGWEQADRVAEPPPVETPLSPAGLPVRRPGTRLVPGGVRKPAAAVARDPEAIRARLAAHAAGVSRGRSAAASTTNHQNPEAGPA